MCDREVTDDGSDAAGASLCGRTSAGGELDVNLVGLDHAKFAARFFFDHVKTFLEVLHFGGQAGIGLSRLLVRCFLHIDLALHFIHAWNAPSPQPQLRVQRRQQGQKD